MKPCIAQVTTLPSTFADDLVNVSAAGFRAIEIWLTKLEQHLESTPAADTRKELAERGLEPVAAAYQGGLIQPHDEARRAHLDHFKRRLDLCQSFGIATLVIAAESIGEPARHSFGNAVARLGQAARWAAGFDVRLALEFRATGSLCTSLPTAVALVEECREPNLGICLDVFHYYKGPSKFEDLDRLSPANLFHVQVCDVAGVPREQMADSDRVLPGDGEFHLDSLVGKLRSIGYRGPVSLELMNPELWNVNPKQVVEVGLTALDRVMQTAGNVIP
jgi:sugar phosphate isomerase/epimerase